LPWVWSPSGSPAPGDTLTIGDGKTGYYAFSDLSGDQLYLTGSNQNAPPTLDLFGGTHLEVTPNTALQTGAPYATINVLAGTNYLDLSLRNVLPGAGGVGNTTINIARGAVFAGRITEVGRYEHFIMNGPGSFDNVSTTIGFRGFDAIINANIIGRGTISFIGDDGAEFGGSVGAGQSILLTGGPASLTVDKTHQFHASVILGLKRPNHSQGSDRRQFRL
jgi:hypothetical protein